MCVVTAVEKTFVLELASRLTDQRLCLRQRKLWRVPRMRSSQHPFAFSLKRTEVLNIPGRLSLLVGRKSERCRTFTMALMGRKPRIIESGEYSRRTPPMRSIAGFQMDGGWCCQTRFTSEKIGKSFRRDRVPPDKEPSRSVTQELRERIRPRTRKAQEILVTPQTLDVAETAEFEASPSSWQDYPGSTFR